jgi:chaperonin GroES
MLTLRPLDDKVVLRVINPPNTLPSGIVLPDSALEKPQKGKVLSVGPGKLLADGARVPLEVVPGDTVLFTRYAGVDFDQKSDPLLRDELADGSILVARIDEILAVIEE